jgi:molybdopterin molybdotransferase
MTVEVEEVWALIDAHAATLPAQQVSLANALGLTLAEPAVADRDAPAFDRSTMDGYAIRADDAAETFRVIGTIAAGDSRRMALAPGEAVRIFTGAEVPGEGLVVVMQEDVAREGESIRIVRRGAGANIARRGEDVRAGETVIPAGTRLRPAEVALLASIGQTRPLVVRPPRILHFTSGDEIVPPDETPGPGKIRDSNATLVRALLAAFPGESPHHAHLPDDEARAAAFIDATGPESFDVLLFSGGASVGDYDFTAKFLQRLGFAIHCSQVNVRPGKPLLFASREGRLAFGIPGNPLSHFVCFHVFIARALARLTGREVPALEPAKLAADFPGAPNRRVTYWPARSGREGVTPVPWNSSGHLAALLGVDALIRVPAEAELPKAGATVQRLALEGTR